MTFRGDEPNRTLFLKKIRDAVIGLTGETMTLDALINEIAKNIWDHAHGIGSLSIVSKEDVSFEFEIKDGGTEAFFFQACINNSRLAGRSKVNKGTGLEMILDYAEVLEIRLKIDTHAGFAYSGVYKSIKKKK